MPPLNTLVYDNKGNAYLNSLLRFAMSGAIVPSQANLVVKVPIQVGTNPGMSLPISVEGPQDAKSVVRSLNGLQGARNLGSGVISSLAVAVTGVGTKFTTELQIGDTIVVAGQSQTVATIINDTSLTTALAFAPVLASAPFAYFTPVVPDVRDRMRVEITDTAWQRRLMNTTVPVNHVFGDAHKPLFLKESILLETNQTMLFKFYNHSTAGRGSFCFTPAAEKWQTEAFERKDVAEFITDLRRRKVFCQPYWLTLDNEARMTPSGSIIQYMTMTGDVFFVAFNVYGHFITNGSTGDTQEGFLIEMFDGKTGREFQNAPVTLNTFAGTSQDPYRLPSPLIVEPQSQLKFRFTNLITNGTFTDVFLTLFGVAVYTGHGAITDPEIIAEAQRIYHATRPDIIPAAVRE